LPIGPKQYREPLQDKLRGEPVVLAGLDGIPTRGEHFEDRSIELLPLILDLVREEDAVMPHLVQPGARLLRILRFPWYGKEPVTVEDPHERAKGILDELGHDVHPGIAESHNEKEKLPILAAGKGAREEAAEEAPFLITKARPQHTAQNLGLLLFRLSLAMAQDDLIPEEVVLDAGEVVQGPALHVEHAVLEGRLARWASSQPK